jgi:fatty acid CoA ligase FadD36
VSVLGTADRDGPAVTVDGVALTRSDLFAAAAAVADGIEGAGVVAIDATPSLSTVVAVVGCLLAGVVAVPVPPDSGRRERAHILTDSGATIWLGNPQPDVPLPVVPIAGRSSSTWVEPAEGRALILYTSGTTGPAKGVPISRAAIRAGLDGLRLAWDWTPDDTLVHGLPLFHVHGLVLGVLGALRVGSPLVHTGRPTPSAYAAAAGSLYFGVPTVWGRVAADPSSARALRGARLLVSGSAALPAPVFRDLMTLTGQAPIERYGMTETLITLAARADGERRAGWVGAPILDVEARVVDDEGGATDRDGQAIGNLEVRGATVFGGYLGRPEQTAAAFAADGWFRTGDAAVVDGAGQHRIVGRAKDDLIKTGGYRVGAGEVEAALLGHPSVSEAAVVGIPDDDLGQRIVAYVVGTGVQAQVLIDHVADELSAHKRPREVRVVDSLPRNAMGKVQKAQLR